MEWLVANWKEILEAFLSILGAFSIIAKLTPNQVDDKVLGKIVGIINFLGLTKK